MYSALQLTVNTHMYVLLAGAGVVGRLGDLATVAPEYDVAVR